MQVETKPKVDHTPAQLDGEAKLLLATADYIETHGLFQGDSGVEGGPMCLGGAGIVVSRNYPEWSWIGAMKRVEAAVGRSYTSWNDAPGRTADEVVSKLRAVALGL